jgi:hypothetical protein
MTCSNVFGNEGGDWERCIEEQSGSSGNMSSEPLFCNMGLDNLFLAEISPCAPAHSAGCGLIGSFEVGCASAVEETTWGSVKAIYRH